LWLIYEYCYTLTVLRWAVIYPSVAIIYTWRKPNGMSEIHYAWDIRDLAVEVNHHLPVHAYTRQVILLGDVRDLVDVAVIHGEVDEGVSFHGWL